MIVQFGKLRTGVHCGTVVADEHEQFGGEALGGLGSRKVCA